MSNEFQLVKKHLSDMGGILNAIPDEPFEMRGVETLQIVLRRMETSDLQRELSTFMSLFSKDHAPTGTELSNAAVSFVKVKTLCEAEQMDFDAKSSRELIKEFKTQKTKVENIINLSKVNALTAEDYQKEAINKTLEKSALYIKAFELEIKKAEKNVEKEPESLIKPLPKEETSEPSVKSFEKPKRAPLKDAVCKIASFVKNHQHHKEVEGALKVEEAKHSDSKCEEIPYYDATLKFTETYVCKDIPEFSLFVRKGNVFFGLTKNANHGVYDNSDNSLLELLNVNDDFIQFLSKNLLSGEYILKPFTDDEKKAMQLYFNFVCVCFEKHIGKTLSASEYIYFKEYYNLLILRMMELDEKKQSDYYRALSLADQYLTYMDSYDLAVSVEKEEIIEDIIADWNINYLNDLELIFNSHLVCTEAKFKLMSLIEDIRYFNGKPKEELSETEEPFDFKDIIIVVSELDENDKRIDEAQYSPANVEKAIRDYLERDAHKKKLSILQGCMITDLFMGKRGSVSVRLLTEDSYRFFSDEDKEFYQSVEKKLNEIMIKIGGYTL